MSDHHSARSRHHQVTLNHRFTVYHQRKQRLLLRALEQMDTSGETPAETRAISQMIVALEAKLAQRQRDARLAAEPEKGSIKEFVLRTKVDLDALLSPPRKRRKRATYGVS